MVEDKSDGWRVSTSLVREPTNLCLDEDKVAGYLAFNGAGVGDTATAGLVIVFDGSSVMNEEDGSGRGIMHTSIPCWTGLFLYVSGSMTNGARTDLRW